MQLAIDKPPTPESKMPIGATLVVLPTDIVVDNELCTDAFCGINCFIDVFFTKLSLVIAVLVTFLMK
jgi:hypothetical protein